MVLERELIHHGREHVRHGGVCHLGALDVKDRGTLGGEGRGTKIPGLVKDWAGKEEAGAMVLMGRVRGIVAFLGGDGVVLERPLSGYRFPKAVVTS